MSRHGWREGQGLGAQLNGKQQPLKIPFKADTRGVGCTANDGSWVSGQQDYGNFLASLRSIHAVDERKTSSLRGAAAKRKVSARSRPHRYTKFARAKDVSLYRQSDLQQILGGSCDSTSDNAAHTIAPNTAAESTPTQPPAALLKKSLLSVQEYFAAKRVLLNAKPTSNEQSNVSPALHKPEAVDNSGKEARLNPNVEEPSERHQAPSGDCGEMERTKPATVERPREALNDPSAAMPDKQLTECDTSKRPLLLPRWMAQFAAASSGMQRMPVRISDGEFVGSNILEIPGYGDAALFQQIRQRLIN